VTDTLIEQLSTTALAKDNLSWTSALMLEGTMSANNRKGCCDARGALRSRPGHDEELADHARPFADVLLHELAAGHADEGAVCVVRHRARQQRLARSRWTVQQDALTMKTHDKQEACAS
jgi:hypothetical protein